MRLRDILITAVYILLFNSCTQDEGYGENSHIKGVLVEKYYNDDFTILQYNSLSKDKDVYILFGDEDNIGDNTQTSFTGDFHFQYLWPGNYKLYYYSDDMSLVSNEKTEIVINIDLKKNQTLNLDTLYTYKALSWDEGEAKIKGTGMLINYRNETEYPNPEVKDITPAQEQEIYMVYNNAEYYTDRIRRQDEGTFVFENLLKKSLQNLCLLRRCYHGRHSRYC